MQNKDLILKACKEAKRLGFQHYMAVPNTTWSEIKNGLDNGMKLHPLTEIRVLNAVQLLGITA